MRRDLVPPPLTVKNYQAALQRFTARILRRRTRDGLRELAHTDGYRSVSKWERSGRTPRRFPLDVWAPDPFKAGDES